MPGASAMQYICHGGRVKYGVLCLNMAIKEILGNIQKCMTLLAIFVNEMVDVFGTNV
jgi:hypothetical protein